MRKRTLRRTLPLVLLGVLVIILMMATVAVAQESDNPPAEVSDKITSVINRITTLMMIIVGAAAVLVIMYMALRMMVAQSPDQAEQAKAGILRVVKGLVIFYLAGLIVSIVTWLV